MAPDNRPLLTSDTAMRRPGSLKGLEEFGWVSLSPSFFMRDLLCSEISVYYGTPNVNYKNLL
jgi:hypothetical protein